MSLNASRPPKRASVPAGLTPAFCYGLIDMGHQPNNFGPEPKEQVLLLFECPKHRIEIDGKNLPRALNITLTTSTSKKSNMRKLLEAWRGKDFTPEEAKEFDLRKILGQPAMLLVVHKSNDEGDTFANIGGVFPVDPDTRAAMGRVENPLVSWDIDNLANGLPNVPDWIKERIKKSAEYRGEKPRSILDHTATALAGPDEPEPLSADEAPF